MSENVARPSTFLRAFLYAVAFLAAASQSPASAAGWTLQTLYSFCAQAQCADGGHPGYGALVKDSTGTYYGTTAAGGAHSAGTLFSVDIFGDETVLHSFCARSHCSDGRRPLGGVAVVKSGTDTVLYGTTYGRGSLTGSAKSYGTAFAFKASGGLTDLVSFCNSSAPDCAGEFPTAALLADGSGNFYGTTSWGGTNFLAGFFCCGTVFKVSAGKPQTILYSFCAAADCRDGARPEAPLIGDGAGNFYGTTLFGGLSGGGTVFAISSAGEERVLYNFCSTANCIDGWQPRSSLVIDGAGNFYGTTTKGGAHNEGVVFKVTPGGSESVLYSFCSLANCADGASPQAGLVIDGSGNLYGTTQAGGANAGGTVFEVAANGQYGLLYSFCAAAGCGDGKAPRAGLLMDKSGNLFGTTARGGANGEGGTVFELAHP